MTENLLWTACEREHPDRFSYAPHGTACQEPGRKGGRRGGVGLVGRREVEPVQEEPDGDGLATHGRTVHDFEFGDGLALIV